MLSWRKYLTNVQIKKVYIYTTLTPFCKMVILKSPPCFFRKNWDEMLGEIFEKKHRGLSWSSSTMLPCGTSSRPHRRVIFFGAFSGSEMGEVNLAVFALPGRTLPSFQMKRSRKRRKRRLLLLWSVKSLPIFEGFFCFCGGKFCWGFMLAAWCCVVGGPSCGGQVWLVKTLFFWMPGQLTPTGGWRWAWNGWARALRGNFDKSPWQFLLCSTRVASCALHRLTSPTATFES